MSYCVNPQAEPVLRLAELIGLPANVTAVKAGHWMRKNNMEFLPTRDDLIISGQIQGELSPENALLNDPYNTMIRIEGRPSIQVDNKNRCN